MGVAKLVHVFLWDETGVTSIEYALLGSLIAVAIVTSAATLGLGLKDFYGMVAGKVLDVTS